MWFPYLKSRHACQCSWNKTHTWSCLCVAQYPHWQQLCQSIFSFQPPRGLETCCEHYLNTLTLLLLHDRLPHSTFRPPLLYVISSPSLSWPSSYWHHLPCWVSFCPAKIEAPKYNVSCAFFHYCILGSEHTVGVQHQYLFHEWKINTREGRQLTVFDSKNTGVKPRLFIIWGWPHHSQ